MEKPDGRIKPVRPTLRWLGCTENDLEITGVQRGGRKQKFEFQGLSFLWQHWLNYKRNLY